MKTEISSVRKVRSMKVYCHPESGEIIQTQGGNYIQLKAWKQKYGADTLEDWLAQ